MEYRHKIMRGTVGVIINKAIRDIRNDPKRSIRNLVDLGDNFSTSATQKRFFSLAREVLKNPDNPYNELLVNMIENVNPETVRTMSLNFGYTGLMYGSDILRQREAVFGKYIPWLLVFDFETGGRDTPDFERIAALIVDAVSLGIYSFVFKIGDSRENLAQVLEYCGRFAECAFFVTVSAGLLIGSVSDRAVRTPNLVLSVDVTDPALQKETDCAFQALHAAKCFYGFHTYYSEENAERLMSDEFMQQMIRNGCLIGCYVNRDRSKKSLEDSVYRFVCTRRGKKGAPLFAMDFYRDISYVGNAISGGEFLRVDSSGKVDGVLPGLNSPALRNLIQT